MLPRDSLVRRLGGTLGRRGTGQLSGRRLGGDVEPPKSTSPSPPGHAYASDQAEHEAATLHFTVSLGRVKAVSKLLDSGVDVNAVDYDLRTAVHVAAGRGFVDVIDVLVTRGAHVNARDRWGHTPLDEAEARAQTDAVQRLKALGGHGGGAGEGTSPKAGGGGGGGSFDHSSYDESAGMALLEHASKGDVDMVVKLLDSGSATPDTADYDRRTAAHLAASENQLEVLRVLVERGANLNFADRWGNYCLDDAVRGGFAEVASFLRANGAVESTANASKPFVLTDPSPQGMAALHQRGLKEFWALSSAEFSTEPVPFASGDDGEIYHARWRELPCVVKTVRRKSPTKQMLTDFGNEIAVLANLRHPNIVLFFGACFDHFPPSLLLEWCTGGSLEQALTNPSNVLDLKKRLRYAHELALGMCFLHKCTVPIIHRDLSPSNVLISGDDVVKVSDFGLAKFMPGDTKLLNDKFTMTGETGSYRYMAPEVFKHEPYNHAVDVYSYALVVYWLFTGAKPFADMTDAVDAVVFAALEGGRPSVDLVPDPRVATLLPRCWAPLPDERPAFDDVARVLASVRKS